MQFRYTHGIPTVESAIRQALRRWANPDANPLIADKMNALADRESEELRKEIVNIWTGELSTLFDLEGQAAQWNEGIEMAIQLLEGHL